MKRHSRNHGRAEAARAAFAAYCRKQDRQPDAEGLIDLLADCAHLAQTLDRAAPELFETALAHWRAEAGQ